MRRFLSELLHHLVCNRTFAFPYDSECNYPRCGNWLDNAVEEKTRC